MSLRNAVLEIKVPLTIIRTFLRGELKLSSYKLQMHQHINHEKENKRIRFAQYSRNELENGSEVLRRIGFCDDCQFSLSNKVKKQKCGIWSSERPQQVYNTSHSFLSGMLWCVLSKNEIVGHYMLGNENVTGQSYERLPRYYVFSRLWNNPENRICKQNSAPSNNAASSRQY